MNVHRGDVVLVRYPFASGFGASQHPALIVQNDCDNRRLENTLIAQITTNLRRMAEPTHVLIEQSTPEGQTAGLLEARLLSRDWLRSGAEMLSSSASVDALHIVIH